MPREGSRVTYWLSLFPALALAATLFAGPVRAELPPLIPRDVFFGNPEKSNPQISPDGTRLAYLAPDEDVLKVWVRTIGKDDAAAMTKDRTAASASIFWAPGGRTSSTCRTTTATRTFTSTRPTSTPRRRKDLTPFDGVRAHVVAVDPTSPERDAGGAEPPQQAGVRRLSPRLRDRLAHARTREPGRRGRLDDGQRR